MKKACSAGQSADAVMVTEAIASLPALRTARKQSFHAIDQPKHTSILRMGPHACI
jgi:hypothetical protein